MSTGYALNVHHKYKQKINVNRNEPKYVMEMELEKKKKTSALTTFFFVVDCPKGNYELQFGDINTVAEQNGLFSLHSLHC